MAERYTRLASLPENQYTVGSPVLIAAGALLKDNQTGKALAQIKFMSISEKQIKAVKICIAAFDVSGKELDGVAEYQYLDLTAARTAEFGHKQAVTLPDAVTRSIEVKCTDVFFADGTVWNAAPNAVWTSLATQKTVLAELGNLAAQYQRDTSSNSKFIPIEHEDLWFCSCGAINHDGETQCHNCRHSKTDLFDALDTDVLRQRDAEYKAAEAEKAAKQAAVDAVQRAKTTKFAIIAAAVIALVVSALLLTTKVIIPNGKYNDAVALMDAGKYEEAIAVFEAMEGYKDSINRIDECKTAILDNKYNDAVVMMDAGEYENAIAAFDVLNGYKDSTTKIRECEIAILDSQYNNAVALMDAGKYYDAIVVFSQLDGHKDSITKIDQCYSTMLGEDKWKALRDTTIGETITFGTYEQDNDNTNGTEDIEWLVIDKQGKRLLVISKYALAFQPYHTTLDESTWETCSLRHWLNHDFFNEAFSATELLLIPAVRVSADQNPDYSTNSVWPTEDRIFLLSVKEANTYFASDDARKCLATDYADPQRGYLNRYGNCMWWLRTTGKHINHACYVELLGEVNTVGAYNTYYQSAVRPAMWIEFLG